MNTVAVVAHRRKTLGGGLDELRKVLADEGCGDPLWFEVPKSRKAPKRAKRAVAEGADLVLVWGGDGMVQRCVDALAGTGVPIGILPAGTANLLATNLGVPIDVRGAVDVAMHGRRRPLDVGVVNGERFAVMAGAGFDALMIRDADRGLKDRVGRLAYVWTGARATRARRRPMRVRVDGATWFEGNASCILVGNVGTITGGLVAFADAEPDDGWLDVGVVTAKGPVQWARVLGRMAAGRAASSKLARTTRGKEIDVKIDGALPYELDGGERPPTKRLEIRVEPLAALVCAPADDGGAS
jgi:diacylglycerol kinase (ATP)